MERTPLIGIVAVALLGIAVAGGLFLGVGSGVSDRGGAALDAEARRDAAGSGAVARSGSDSRSGDSPRSGPISGSGPGMDAGVDPEILTGTESSEIPQAPPPPLDDPPGPPVYEPPPPGPLESPWEDARNLLEEPVFDSLDAGSTYADAMARVQDRLDAVDAVAARYRSLADANPDPQTRDEALRLQADLYEQAAQSIPIVPPMVDGHEAWMEDHAEITGELMEKAERLRGE